MWAESRTVPRNDIRYSFPWPNVESQYGTLRSRVPYCSVRLREEIPSQGHGPGGLLSVAESALTTKVGSSTRGPPIAPCDPVPWYAWRPVEAGWSGGMHKGGGWASRGPTRPCPLNNKLGSESCLWRRKGLLLPCQRSSRSSEPPVDGASTPLRGHCSEITYPLLGSVCPTGVLPSASAGWAEPIPEGALPE